MNEELALVGIGVVCTLMYCIAGIGVSRAVSRIKNRDIRLFEVLFWPIVLGVIAASGDISD